MDRRLFVMSLAVAAVAGLLSPLWAADETKTHEGIIVSASADKLVMTDNQGKNEHSHMVSTAAKITLDGKAAKLADLKKGQFVKVTTTKATDGKESVTAIDARTSK
jgi:hypothetical protein